MNDLRSSTHVVLSFYLGRDDMIKKIIFHLVQTQTFQVNKIGLVL